MSTSTCQPSNTYSPNHHLPSQHITHNQESHKNLLTRGVTPPSASDSAPRITCCLDWLAYTVPVGIGFQNAFLPHRDLALTGEVSGDNRKGYNRTLALTHGTVSYHTDNPNMKLFVQFTGSDLAELFMKGVPASDLLRYALSMQAHLTRLDFAVDYIGPSSLKDLDECWKRGSLNTPANRNRKFTEGRKRATEEELLTYDIGSPKSARFVCCYDKARELGVPGPWTRIELRTRDDFAQSLGSEMLRHGIPTAGKAAIRDFVKCDVPWFVAAVNGPDVELHYLGKRKGNRKKWLSEQVAPLLRRQLENDVARGDFELLRIFQNILAGFANSHPSVN